MHPAARTILGLDIGGTKTACVEGTLDGQILQRTEMPTRATQPAVAKKVKLGQSPSSPGPIPSAISATRIASVPELTPRACFAPVNSASARSNRSTSGPRIK